MQAQDPNEECAESSASAQPSRHRRYPSALNPVTIGLGVLCWAVVAGVVILLIELL